MAWDFSTDSEWAEQLGWVEEFVRAECEPIDPIVKESHDLNDPVRQVRREVRRYSPRLTQEVFT
jgi:acyl-CoA dehydrogenase